MPQTSYSANMSAAFEGQLADNGPNDIITRVQGEASAGMEFGLMLAEDTSVDSDAILLVDANSVPVGVLVRSQAYGVPDEYDPENDGVQPGAHLNILRKGRIWVAVEEAVTKGDPI